MSAARDSISRAIRTASSKGEPALVAFLTAGYPSREQFREHLQAVAAGADVAVYGPCICGSIALVESVQALKHAAAHSLSCST